MNVEVERSGLCRNCGTPVASNFCPHCGQETRLHPLSVWAFVHEFIGHYVAVEGKLWRTLALLALEPGRLTKEFLAGRRQRYVIPLRLYLTASFLFFALSQWTAQPLSVHVIHVTDRQAPSGQAPATKASPVPLPEAVAPAPDQTTQDLIEARRELAQGTLGLSARRWQDCIC